MFKVCKEVIVYINVIFKFKNHKKKIKKYTLMFQSKKMLIIKNVNYDIHQISYDYMYMVYNGNVSK